MSRGKLLFREKCLVGIPCGGAGGGEAGDFQRELFRGNCPWNKSLVSNCPRGQLLRGKCADTLKNIS